CVDPRVPPVASRTSPNWYGQLPLAARIVCHSPPLLSMGRICRSPSALVAQATWKSDVKGTPVASRTSPNWYGQLPLAARIVCQSPPLLSMATICRSPPAWAAQATCCVDPRVPPVASRTSPNWYGQLPLAARIVCHSPPLLSIGRTCRSPCGLVAQ